MNWRLPSSDLLTASEVLTEDHAQDDVEYSSKEKQASIGLGILFSAIQTYVIIKKPSFATTNKNILQKCGTVHVVVTNIIVWIQTLLEETSYSLCNCSQKDTISKCSKSKMFIILKNIIWQTLRTKITLLTKFCFLDFIST